MKTLKQIQDRITFLESRQKDGIPVESTLSTLQWGLTLNESEIREWMIFYIDSNEKLPFRRMYDMLWLLED